MKFGVDESFMKRYPIISGGPLYGHIPRMKFYDRLLANTPEIFDLYGRGDFRGDHYRDSIEDKWSALKNYRYSLAIENYHG